MNALIEEMTKAGALLGTEGCLPTASASFVSRTRRRFQSRNPGTSAAARVARAAASATRAAAALKGRATKAA